MYLCIQGDPKKCIIRILISNLFYMSDFTFPHVFWNQKKTHAFLAFLGHLWFSMGNIKMARWNGLKILIPKHMWKTKIELQEQIWGQNPYDTFFLGHPVVSYHRLQQFKWALLTSSGRGLFRWVLSWSTFFILVHLYIQLVGGSCEETWGGGGED